jgi:hypothetical protein
VCECGGIHIGYSICNINISDSVFSSISSSYTGSDLSAGAVYYNMSATSNGYYNISGNTFSDISTNKSVLVLSGSFSSLLFSYNTFYNVSSTDKGGVIFFNFIFLFFYFFLFYFLYFFFFCLFIYLILFYFNKGCLRTIYHCQSNCHF